MPKEKWVINQMNSHFQQARVPAQQCTLTSPRSSSDAGTVANDPVRKSSDFTGVQHFQVELSMNQVYQLSENDKENILDNGSTMSLFRDPSLVSDVAMATWPIEIATNAGRRIVTHKAKVDGFGEVWYNEDAIANIFSLKDLIKKHKVTFDSSKENAFIVHRKNDIIKFPANKLGLYTYEVPGSKAAVKPSYLIDTVKENRAGYTQGQFNRAVRARELYHLLGAPTLENYKGFIKMNGVHNCPVRLQDIKIAENIFGPDMATLKGRSTRPRPKPVLEDWIELPKEIMRKHAEIELCMDIMFINGVKLMTAIDRTIRFRSVVPV